MRIDPNTCRDPDLLAAEVRRLRGVIAAGEPTLTDDERQAIMAGAVALESLVDMYPRDSGLDAKSAATLRGLFQRTK